MSLANTLFEYCINVVLGSPYLLERVSLNLPRGISYFLLYLALETRNQLAVRKIVEKWPHEDLTLDFLSESPLCRRHRSDTPHCLEPHEYLHVFGSYARYSCHEMVSSLLEGVFYNLYSFCAKTEEHVGLRVFDMSYVIVDVHQIPLLLNLVNGRIPVTHIRDYVSDREAEKLRISRPHLKSCAAQFMSPLTLYVNLLLDYTTSRQTIDTLVEICSHSEWVEIKLRGINLLGVNSALLDKFRAVFDALLSPAVEHIYLTESCFGEWQSFTTPYQETLSLWMSRNVTPHSQLLKVPISCRNLLISTYERSPQLAITLTELTSNPCTLRAFCLMRHNMDISKSLSAALGSFLVSISASLEYLQLQGWSFTSTDLSTLQQCSKLRVLSITEDCASCVFNSPKHSVPDILTAISQLPHLEFVQWSENLNLTTYGLFCLYRLLTNSFKSLRHFHVSFQSLILSTTDLENQTYTVMKSVLLPMLSGLKGCEAFTSFIFVFKKIHDTLLEWLSTIRPEVCFRLCKEVSQVPELSKAVTVYNHVH